MMFFVGGLRGSAVMASADYLRYGGDTTSFLIEGQGGERIVIDLGTGISRIGRRLELGEVRPLTVLMTHYHLDHVMGMPQFSALYREGQRVEITAPRILGRGPADVLPRLAEPPLWPVPLGRMGANIHFDTIEGGEPVTRGGLTIRWMPIHHPDGCVSYRIDEAATRTSVVVATDLEWGLSTAGEREAFLAFCRTPAPPSLLLFDAQFTTAEYPEYRGWGHSTWQEAVEVARATGALRLRALHHAPWRKDRELDVIDQEIRHQLEGSRAGREGEEIFL